MVKIPFINDEQRDNIEVDDDIVLPADTLAILNEFLREKAETESTENSQSFEENWVSYDTGHTGPCRLHIVGIFIW